ncbi:HTH_Tnp_Tc3_2 domain-containing protein [Trichonephila clavipes]|nr:HTH_Tnp_Tc3_2 domain-containing protein [Trichonephila clavipes]
MDESDVSIRRYWEEWVNSGKFQRLDGSGQPLDTTDREDRLIVRSAVTEPDSSLSTIRRVTRTRVSTTTIHRWVIERNLGSYRPLRHLRLTPSHCRARLQWCLALSACQILPSSSGLPDFSLIEHLRDRMGRRLNLLGKVDDMARQL